MTKPHDFKKFPELHTNQLPFHSFSSPHKQITQDFNATVIDVHDGDTIKVRWIERDFDFPIRFLGIDAPELDQTGGKESKDWLEKQILGREVLIKIDPKNRVGKWGRILGTIISGGANLNEQSLMQGYSGVFQ